jgi:hypothetical protein
MTLLLRRSEWTYKTGATGAGGFGPILFSGGNIILDDPARTMYEFAYRGVGMGQTFARLPEQLQLPDLRLPSFIMRHGAVVGSGATTDYFGGGSVQIMPGCPRKELRPDDFNGATVYIDASAGVLVAGGVSVLLCGINQYAVLAAIANPGLFIRPAINTARAALLIYGASEGLVDSVSAAFMFGGMALQRPVGIDRDKD